MKRLPLWFRYVKIFGISELALSALVAGFGMWVAWWIIGFLGGQRFLYQHVYGTRSREIPYISLNDEIVDVPEQPLKSAVVNGMKIEFEIVKYFKTTTYVAYVDRYIGRNTWVQRSLEKYNRVSAQDVTTLSGQLGVHPDCVQVGHVYHYSGWQPGDSPECEALFNAGLQAGEINNNHVIAANKNVQKGLDILRAGDVATLEGYLIDWHLADDSYWNRSATYLGQKTNEHEWLCRHLYLTRLTFDGYTFD